MRLVHIQWNLRKIGPSSYSVLDMLLHAYFKGNFSTEGSSVCDDDGIVFWPAVQLHTASAHQQTLDVHLCRGVGFQLMTWTKEEKKKKKLSNELIIFQKGSVMN